ncbi:MAG: hypothetical protein J5I92_00970 [Thiogranum sp.]|nr:hypothetical protein [Thiogranum sp.]
MNTLCFKRFIPAFAPTLIALSVMLSGCGGGSEDDTVTGAATVDTTTTPALFAFFDSDADGTGDSIARIDTNTDAVLETAVTGVSSGGGTHKQFFYEGPIWVGGGGLVWGVDPDTLEVIPRVAAPSIQGNREGTIGPAIVDTRSTAGSFSPVTTKGADLRQYFDLTTVSVELAAIADACLVRESKSGIDRDLASASMLRAIDEAEPFHNMGYSPVGIEPAPDGKITMFAVRQGDHSFFLDTDPDSATFGQPLRFVYPRLGQVKDSSNAVVSLFNALYDVAGGTAPGNAQRDRTAAGTSEVDKETYTEPCDSVSLRNAQGEVWSFWPDVEGDTLTGVNMDTIAGGAPQVVQVAVPIITRPDAPASAGGVGSSALLANGQRVGPWMASLSNRNVGNELLFHVETEGDNSELIMDVTDPDNIVEIQRLVTDLKHVLAVDVGAASLVDGNIYQVRVSFESTGGGVTLVDYEYVSLPGDDGSGVSPDVTRAYLSKVNDTDPGPGFIVNGLNGRAGTSEGNIARIQGSGTDAILYSDEIWLLTNVGADGFQILDLIGDTPYRIKETFNHPSSFAGFFGPDGEKFYQLRAGSIDVINTATRKLTNVISLDGAVTGIAPGAYQAIASAPATGGGTTAPGGGGGGGGGVSALPPNPCG